MVTTVRIQAETYSKLRQIARESGVSIPEILAEAIDDLYRTRFLEKCNAAYDRLKNDSRWKQELGERKAWERTINDGLEEA